MEKLTARFAVVPYLLVGIGLLVLGLVAINHIMNNFWPIDVTRLDLIRAIAQDRAESAQLLRAGNLEFIMVFLASVLVAVTGLSLPLAYYLNKRFGRSGSQRFLVVLRQAMWVGIWVAFCVWLQMNRSLSIGVALLVAGVLVTVEILLQIRTKAAEIVGNEA
jgi:hypothetical protein